MLYDTSFIKSGEIFPPYEETERLQNYKDNLLLFKDSTYLVSKRTYKDSAQRVLRVLNDYSDLVGYPIELNYHKLTSTSISDLVCGEKPTIKIKTTSENEKLLEDINFYTKLKEWVIDISRFGDSVARVYSKEELSGQSKGAVAVCQPSTLFKIVDIEDKDSIKCYVLAIPIELPESTEKKPLWELRVQEHYKGYYIKKSFKIEPIEKIKTKQVKLPSGRTDLDLRRFEIKGKIDDDTRVDTGLSDFAVVTMHQLITSDSCYGHDDYSSLDPILAEIWARLGEVALILDKHSRPDVYAGINAFEQDKNGNWHLKVGGGNTYIVGAGEQPPGYLTWDGQLVACFNELNLLFDQLYKVSEMGPIYEIAGKNANISWDTMKANFTKPLAKARRITTDIEPGIKKIISLVAELNGVKIETADISITWFDGLPNDEKQEIEKATMKINADLSTPEQENIDRFGFNEVQAKEIAKSVSQRNATKQSQLFGGFQSQEFGEDGE